MAMTQFERSESASDGPVRVEGASCRVGTQQYSVLRYFRDGRPRASEAALLAGTRKLFKSVTREAALSLGEYNASEIEGTAADGSAAWVRAYPVGDGFLLAQVAQTQGAIERNSAREFLESVRFSPPWSVHAFPAGRFSAWLPDGSQEFDRTALHAENFAVARAFLLGGKEERLFLVYSAPLTGTGVTPDERMDRGAEAMMNSGTRIVWQGPLDVDAARGREYLLQMGKSWSRLRLVVTDADLYMLQANAASKSALLQSDVQEFLDSLRWYPER